MTSLIGSLTNFNGDPRDDGPATEPRLKKRGDPELLLGDRGGALPAGNIEGNALLVARFVPPEMLGTLNGSPSFASSIKDLTYMPKLTFQNKLKNSKSRSQIE